MGNIGVTDIKRMPDYNRAKLQSEALIRQSGRPYTIIRPAWVVPGNRGAKLEQGDHYTGRRDDIGSIDLGSAVVAAFESTAALGKTFELYGGGQLEPDWTSDFSSLAPDT